MAGLRPAGRPVAHSERRDLLLDACAEVVRRHGVEAVSMESVAQAAGVSRPLLYKHFPNRDAVLAALFRREAAAVHRRLARRVAAACDLESMFDELVGGALEVCATDDVLLRLLEAGVRTASLAAEQRARDARTARAFAGRAVAELGLEPDDALQLVAMLLTLVPDVLRRWLRAPTPERARLLTRTYRTIVRGALAEAGRGQVAD